MNNKNSDYMRFTTAFARSGDYMQVEFEPGAHYVRVYVFDHIRRKRMYMTFDRASGKYIGMEFIQLEAQ